MKIIKLALVCSCLFPAIISSAQENPIVSDIVQHKDITSGAEKNLQNQIDHFQYNTESADAIWQTLLQGLKNGEFIADVTVLKAANYKMSYVPTDRDRLTLTTQLLIYVDKRPLLKNQIESWRLNYMYFQLPDSKFAKSPKNQDFINESERYLKDIQKMSWELDKMRITQTSNLAHVVLHNGDYKKADTLFGQVFSYPWWKIADYDTAIYFLRLYVEAGKSLIRVREGNVKALQSLKFAPGVADQLKPLLDQAIADAKKKDALEK